MYQAEEGTVKEEPKEIQSDKDSIKEEIGENLTIKKEEESISETNQDEKKDEVCS